MFKSMQANEIRVGDAIFLSTRGGKKRVVAIHSWKGSQFITREVEFEDRSRLGLVEGKKYDVIRFGVRD